MHWATAPTHSLPIRKDDVRIELDGCSLAGTVGLPARALGLVIFAHGSGSSRLSPRNRHVAMLLQRAGLATLLFDLLTPEEERADLPAGQLRFDIRFLARRLEAVTRWAKADASTAPLRVGYFGASTGAAAALRAAANAALDIGAVVSRGGRPDLAEEALEKVHAPVLLVVGGNDAAVLGLNRRALDRLRGPKHLEIVAGASHLFEEPGALDSVAELAARWFVQRLVPLHP